PQMRLDVTAGRAPVTIRARNRRGRALFQTTEASDRNFQSRHSCNEGDSSCRRAGRPLAIAWIISLEGCIARAAVCLSASANMRILAVVAIGFHRQLAHKRVS